MPNVNGFYKEAEIVAALNDKRVCDIHYNMRYFLKEIFGVLDENKLVHAERIEGVMKPDFWVEYDGRKYYVSLKTGSTCNVHQEMIDMFIDYLRKNNIS